MIFPTISAVTHVFEGEPDARQSESVFEPISRFRPVFRALRPEEKKLHDDIKAKAAELEALYELVHSPRYKALALTELEVSVFWIIKGLTS